MSKKILITAPSMQNVSGMTEIVKNILKNKNIQYLHFITGSKDGERKNFIWFLRQITMYSKFFWLLVPRDISHVHLNTAFNSLSLTRDFLLTLISKTTNHKLLLHIHGGRYINEDPPWLFSKMIYILLHSANNIIVLSEQEKRKIEENYGVDNIDVLKNCIDCSRLENLKNKNKHTLKALFIGRIERDKGIMETLDAMMILVKKGLNIQLILCGTGRMKEEIVFQANKTIKENFVYKGIVVGEQKWKIISDADFFILPSYFEGLPMALLECMSLGVVPIVTKVGSIPTVVEDQFNGYFVPKYNSNAIADTMEKLIWDTELRLKISLNALETSKKFCCDKYMISLEKIYKKMELDF